jgi:hypothetical protein
MVTGGFMYSLHNQIAARGGFRIKYVVTPGISLFPSRLEYFQRVLPYVDLWASAVGPAASELIKVVVLRLEWCHVVPYISHSLTSFF